MSPYKSIQWVNNQVVMIDQRCLPQHIEYIIIQNYREVISAIRDMVIRGAPAIGAAGAYGLALAAIHEPAKNEEHLMLLVREAAADLRLARPTAVNLAWAVNRVIARLECSTTFQYRSNPPGDIG